MSNKQEEIREGVAEKIFEGFQRNSRTMELPHMKWRNITGATRGMILAITDIVLEYEASQGVVIKVGEIEEVTTTASQPETFYAGGKTIALYSTERTNYIFKALKQANFVAVELLIKEVEDG